jgi:hypothetical protein
MRQHEHHHGLGGGNGFGSGHGGGGGHNGGRGENGFCVCPSMWLFRTSSCRRALQNSFMSGM